MTDYPLRIAAAGNALDHRLDPAGGLSIHWGGRKVAWNPFPLEMEKAGKVHYGVLSRKSRTTLFGCLADDQGIFLTCEISFRPRRFGKTPFLEEKRVYRAVRDIPKALLTVRQHLEGAPRKGDGFLVIPALWYGAPAE